MAKISMFLVGDNTTNANIQGKLVPQIIGPTVALRPNFVPGVLSFCIAVGVNDLDISQEHTVAFSIIDPSGKEVQKSEEAKIPAGPMDTEMPKTYHGVMLNIDIRNMSIPEDGVYLFKLVCDHECLDTKEIPIYHAKQNN